MLASFLKETAVKTMGGLMVWTVCSPRATMQLSRGAKPSEGSHPQLAIEGE